MESSTLGMQDATISCCGLGTCAEPAVNLTPKPVGYQAPRKQPFCNPVAR